MRNECENIDYHHQETQSQHNDSWNHFQLHKYHLPMEQDIAKF